jgi:hypothetical protein
MKDFLWVIIRVACGQHVVQTLLYRRGAPLGPGISGLQTLRPYRVWGYAPEQL